MPLAPGGKSPLVWAPDDATREADLRLDRKEGIFSETASGAIPVVAGDPEASELIRRIESADPAEQMPPPEAIKQLSAEERSKLAAWVKAGAEFKQGFFGEIEYNLIPKAAELNPSGFGVRIGYRF